MKLNKKIIFIFAVIFTACTCFYAEGAEYQKKFIRGNLADKTAAVREASGNEAAELSKTAIEFAVSNKEILGNDRDLAALAVAGVLSLPADYVEKASAEEKEQIESQLLNLFNIYSDDTVRIAVLNKLSVINIPTDKFSSTLDDFMKSDIAAVQNSAVIKAAVATLGVIGTDSSFRILYECINLKQWEPYKTEIEQVVGRLSEKAFPEIVNIIRNGDIKECRQIFDLVENNENNSQIFKAEIAENVLAKTIYISENSSSADRDTEALQLDSLRVLAGLKWTRASKTVVAFFDTAVKEYEAGTLNANDFVEVINGVAVTAPIDVVNVFSSYLTKLNKLMESPSDKKPADNVVLAIISALGAIGDKHAFDSLLAVTYYNYPDNIIAAARDALAELKW